ncbi:MAG TPA: hypothetical protein VNP96_08375 [Solirubrobacterales bacterium]|nr:hypothetical protein [Solirubrobacterales bacterium]
MDQPKVHRYLSQSRLAEDPAAAPSPISENYQRTFAELKERLAFDPADSPELFVAYTPEARVETLEIDGDCSIVYDQRLGQSFNRLNDFALADWPQPYVIQWGLKHLAVALAGCGDSDAAGAALMCSQVWPVKDRPTTRSKEIFPVRMIVTAIQEHFVLAHECVHAAIERGLPTADRAEFVANLDAVAAFLDEQTGNPDEAERQMIQDEARAVQAMSGAQGTPDPQLEERLRSARAQETRDGGRAAGEILAGKLDLREELLCDQIASELVLAKFAAMKLDFATILTSILHAFHNLTSLSVIRSLARDWREDGPPSPELQALTVRKGVWRTNMRATEEALGLDREAHSGFVEITELHASTVGDPILFILPFEFHRIMEKLDGESFDKTGVYEALHALGTQPPGLPSTEA